MYCSPVPLPPVEPEVPTDAPTISDVPSPKVSLMTGDGPECKSRHVFIPSYSIPTTQVSSHGIAHYPLKVLTFGSLGVSNGFRR